MATYADLKARIVREMVRDDLLDDLADTLTEHVADACNEYSDVRFWFNQTVQQVSTVADITTVAVPVAMRIIDRVAGPYGDLTPMILRQFPNDGIFPQTGLPTYYTYLDGPLSNDATLTFNVTPDDAYSLTLYGLSQIAAPVDDEDSNAWTNEAQALIASHVRMTLYRDQFRDPEGEASAGRAVQSNLNKLKRETDRRLRTRLAAQLVAPNGQSVRRSFMDRF